MGLNPPAEIQGILQQRIAEWRGEAPPAAAQSVMPADEPVENPVPAGPMSEGAVVRANVSLSDAAASALSGDTVVFIIARDPAQPRPPIAAVRRRAVELPAVVTFSDSDAMIPGRLLSGFSELEIIARVSMSGQPVAQPGDWYGDKIVRPSELAEISIVIDREVQ